MSDKTTSSEPMLFDPDRLELEPIVPEPSAPKPEPSAGMNSAALVFLDDPIARKLAVAWTTCRGDEASWLPSAGLMFTSQVRALQAALKMNGICRPGGVTDPLAMQYISTLVAEPLTRMRAREKK